MTVYVSFEIRPLEDRKASIETGCARSRDADFALLRMSGDQHTELEFEITPEKLVEWKSRDHLKHIPAAYESWKHGQEQPLNGIGLSTWPQITPSQLKMAESLHIRTVEDFANLTQGGIEQFGAGGQTLKQKAQAYLQAAAGPGKVAEQFAAQDAEMKMLKDQMGAMQRALAEKDNTIAVLSTITPSPVAPVREKLQLPKTAA